MGLNSFRSRAVFSPQNAKNPSAAAASTSSWYSPTFRKFRNNGERKLSQHSSISKYPATSSGQNQRGGRSFKRCHKKANKWRQEYDKESTAQNGVLEKNSSKPHRTPVGECSTSNHPFKPSTTSFDRPNQDSVTESSHALDKPWESRTSREVPPSGFVAGTDYFTKPRRVPEISDAKRRQKYKEIHDLYFIGWGGKFTRFER